MSTLIPMRQWDEIRRMTLAQLRLLKACEVYDGDVARDENYVYTHIPRNPYDGVVEDRIRIRVEQLGMSSNSIYPKRPEEVLVVEDKWPNLTKAREARKAKKALA